MKRITALLLCLLLALSLAPASLAEEGALEIATAEELRAFAKSCALESYSRGRVFRLSADIDLGGLDFEPVPYFAGTFLGQGHAITGLRIEGEGSRLGLFRELAQGAVLRDLTVSGRVAPGGSRLEIGGLVGLNAGAVESCAFSGSVAGLENVGGLAGLNTETGSLLNCRFSGEVRGEHQVGGAAGVNRGLIQGCANEGAVNNLAITPERKQEFNIAAFTEDDFLDLANIGGLAGDNAGTVRDCENSGPVGYARTGYNVGGIAGRSDGFLSGCVNRGPVRARRDAGGVVGQLVPHTVWDFSEDRLKGLSGELDTLSAQLDAISRSAEERSRALQQGADTLRGSVGEARDALAGVLSYYTGAEGLDPIELIPWSGQGDGPDLSGLTAALEKLQQESVALSLALGEDLTALPEELGALQRQLGRVRQSLSAALGSVTEAGLLESFDLSADESYEHEPGAVEACRNEGSVESESSAGGVAGSMAFELEFDSEDRLQASRLLTSDAKRYLFAVLRKCENSGPVTVRSDHAGGLVGRCEIGAVADCSAACAVTAEKGDYVGGAAGRSAGTLRGCAVRAELAGGKYVGGLAGSGGHILGCAAWVSITRGAEHLGAVAGFADGEVRDNRYVEGPAPGVDGVSREGQCLPVSPADFLALEGVPADFGTLEVRFVAEGRLIETRQVPFGGSLGPLPAVENDGVRRWQWDDPGDGPLYSDLELGGRYLPPLTVLATGEDPPLCLAEGRFDEDQRLALTPWQGSLSEGTLLSAGTVTVAGYEGALTVHLRAEKGGRLGRLLPDGSIESLAYTVDKSYLVFPLENGGTYLYWQPPRPAWIPWAAGAAVLLSLGLWLLLSRRKKRAKARKGQSAPTV